MRFFKNPIRYEHFWRLGGGHLMLPKNWVLLWILKFHFFSKKLQNAFFLKSYKVWACVAPPGWSLYASTKRRCADRPTADRRSADRRSADRPALYTLTPDRPPLAGSYWYKHRFLHTFDGRIFSSVRPLELIFWRGSVSWRLLWPAAKPPLSFSILSS